MKRPYHDQLQAGCFEMSSRSVADDDGHRGHRGSPGAGLGMRVSFASAGEHVRHLERMATKKRNSRSSRRQHSAGATGRPHGLVWSVLPDGTVHTITSDGAIYTILHDRRKRKWTLGGTNQEFLGSAIRRRDAQRLAQQIEDTRRSKNTR